MRERQPESYAIETPVNRVFMTVGATHYRCISTLERSAAAHRVESLVLDLGVVVAHLRWIWRHLFVTFLAPAPHRSGHVMYAVTVRGIRANALRRAIGIVVIATPLGRLIAPRIQLPFQPSTRRFLEFCISHQTVWLSGLPRKPLRISHRINPTRVCDWRSAITESLVFSQLRRYRIIRRACKCEIFSNGHSKLRNRKLLHIHDGFSPPMRELRISRKRGQAHAHQPGRNYDHFRFLAGNLGL